MRRKERDALLYGVRNRLIRELGGEERNTFDTCRAIEEIIDKIVWEDDDNVWWQSLANLGRLKR